MKPSAKPLAAQMPRTLLWRRANLPLQVSVLLLACGLILLGRRLAGAFEHALPAVALGMAGAALAVGGEFLRRRLLAGTGASAPGREERTSIVFQLLGWLPVLSGWLIGAAISLPGSSGLGLAGLWLCLSLGGLWAAQRQWLLFGQQHLHRARGTGLQDAAVTTRLSQGSTVATPAAAAPSAVAPTETIDAIHAEGDETTGQDSLSPDVLQHFIRRRDSGGGEWITGTLRVALESGQRTAITHVAFCPPFPSTPSCDAEPVSGPEAELRIAQVLPQGARFDVRLDEAAREPLHLLVEFAAHWQPPEESGPR